MVGFVVGFLVVAVGVGVRVGGSSTVMSGMGTIGRLTDAEGAVAMAAGGPTVARLTVDERPTCVVGRVSSVDAAVVTGALGICAGLEDALGAEVARTVAVIVIVTCAWAPEVWVPTRLIAAVARAAIDSATASHPAARAAA